MNRLFLLIAIYFWIQTVPVCAQDDGREPLRWFRYSYFIVSSYPHLRELPDWSKIPTLLDWINREGDDAGIDVAYSQLTALSRVDFKHPRRPPAGGLSKEMLQYYRSERAEAWARWWDSVGRNYGERLPTQGRQNPEAWKLVIRDKAQPLPDYKVMIPDEWTLRASYRAGDYDGVQTESLTLHRTREKATLIRALRKSTKGRLEWERWEPLTTEQADTFAFAMAYAIDHPWLVVPDRGNDFAEKLEGRDLTTYYANFRHEFADKDGNIWWNDDPWSWHGRDYFRNTPGLLGSVCVLLWRTFPDNATTNTLSSQTGKWRPMKMPDSMALQSVVEDLAPRGEVIEALWHDQRISDGLEALAEFGAPPQIPAINQLEAELPLRLEKVKTILKQDPNKVEYRKLRAERLLAAAAKAKAAIQKRNNDQK